jgi:beta-galactosidase
VLGDFTWTGWDYLGEVGVGRVEYGDQPTKGGMAAFAGDYPWLTAWCGDIDITGVRRPQSFYREIVFGLRQDPYIAVLRPEHHGRSLVHASPWAFSDVVSSWTWPGHESSPVQVEVYSDADEVELLVNGTSCGRRPAGPDHDFRATFEACYEPGQVEAVAWRNGVPAERMTLRTATGPVQLKAHIDRTNITASTVDAAFFDIALVDAAGNLHRDADRRVTVTVDGPGTLQGLASANPRSEESFTSSSCRTYEGRALAVVRPTGQGTISVTVAAENCAPQVLSITAASEPTEISPAARG